MSPKALKNNAETLRYVSIIDTQRKASHLYFRKARLSGEWRILFL